MSESQSQSLSQSQSQRGRKRKGISKEENLERQKDGLGRQKTREFLHALNKQKDEGEDCNKLLIQLDKNFINVNNPREAVNDAMLFESLAKMGAKEAQKMLEQDGITLDDFISRLKSGYGQMGGGPVDWAKVGSVTSTTIDETPRQCTIYGPLQKELSQRKVAKRRTTHTKRATTFDRPDKVDSDSAADLATKQKNRRIRNQHKVYEEREGPPLDMFEATYNPYSFSQTVENMFDLSFLVREGKAKITLEKDKRLTVTTAKSVKVSEKIPTSQTIVRLDMAMLQNMMMPEETPIPVRESDDLTPEWTTSQQHQRVQQSQLQGSLQEDNATDSPAREKR